MVVCSCRDIRDSQYSSKEELIARVLEDDHCCGQCIELFLVDGGDIVSTAKQR